MRGLFVSALALALIAGCADEVAVEESATAPDEHDVIMDQIEGAIELPPDASPLNQYRRHYAYDDAKVVAVYLSLGAGGRDRQWHDNSSEFPMIFDGGCGVIHIVYDPRTEGFDEIFCNGEA